MSCFLIFTPAIFSFEAAFNSLRDKDLLSISGWWTSLTTTEINEIHRMLGMENQIQENNYYIIKGSIFEDNSGKKITSFGITSKKINEFALGEIAIFKDNSEVTIDENGNYVWKSKTKFTKKKYNPQINKTIFSNKIDNFI